MLFCYSPGYMMELPAQHRFPMGKYGALYDILRRDGLVRPADVVAPDEIEWAKLELVHTHEYLHDLAAGTLTPAAQRRLGFPWSHALVRRARLAAQGTLMAAEAALADGVATNLAGGTHHAFPDRGEGFCTLNDVAVTVRHLHRAGRLRRALIVDLDVHQGNGTAAIFGGDESTARPASMGAPGVDAGAPDAAACNGNGAAVSALAYTFSMHGAKNYPFRKERSHRDVPLPDGMGDEDYLALLRTHLEAALLESRPELIFYLAGVDVLAGDRFGRLALSRDGLHRRDCHVLEAARASRVPIVLLLSGGYARTPEETADLHSSVHRAARKVFGE